MAKSLEYSLFAILIIVITVLGFVHMSSLKSEPALAPEQEQLPEVPEIEKAMPEEPQKEMSSPSADIIETADTLSLEISEKAGYEQKFDIAEGATVIWTNPANVRRQIICYTGDKENRGPTVFTAYAYEGGDTVSYVFNEPGDFMCIANVYSLKWEFNVIEGKTEVTGSVILDFFKSMFD